ncbi:asparagine synthase (glutamine-hydrolyzing) [Lysobacter panacisoli]|uniref:asparagine synthase (glutamine-hydrolyzing) n=1 Tax=Lysobacter panacisoli TaxID=1255263 RepID=A0ABP9L563_9GAMM|nr:asparagine synthase (glutamine-hydrolyzing) [Lysobacter panacisoli]
MCGIAGFVGTANPEALKRMTDRIAHRGPDSAGFFSDDEQRVHLAHRRLSILDIAGGYQPMRTLDGRTSIVFNGEIYNFRELRIELEGLGARFQSDHSDTEVLLHAWRHWGPQMVHRLNGMWAFALHDRERRLLFLSKDRFGKKPLYYHASAQGFVFASELTALREHPAVPATLSARALRKYFGYGFVPAPLTFLENVYKLPGGHSLTLSLDTLQPVVQCYWEYQPEPFDERPANAEERWQEELRERLDAAVKRRLVADVPVGSFLSGGIDSSTISALAIRHVGRERLKTFSIGFDEATFDESAHAQTVATHIGAEHHLERLSVQRALEILPDIAARLDEPIADSSILPTYLLCEHARRHVTVAIGGDGADELFAGYDPFVALRYARYYDAVMPRPVHRAVSLAVSRLPVSHRYMSLDFRLKRTLRGMDHPKHLRLPVWMSPLAPSELAELFDEPIDLNDLYSESIEAWDGCASTNDVDRTIAFYVKLYLQDDILVKVDRASMLHSLEVRAPFLDCDLVDFARRLPADTKLRGGTTKWILKQVARSLLPEEIVNRPKQGFGVPIGQWFRDQKIPSWQPPFAGGSDFDTRKRQLHVAGRSDERAYLWSDWILGHSHLCRALPQ